MFSSDISILFLSFYLPLRIEFFKGVKFLTFKNSSNFLLEKLQIKFSVDAFPEASSVFDQNI